MDLSTCSAVYFFRMNRFATLLGFFAIVIFTAMGSSSSMLFCEHESGDGHLISLAEHSGAQHEDSCHSHSALLSGEHSDEDVCDSCTDTIIGGDDSPDVLRASSQDRFPAPQVAAVAFDWSSFSECLKLPASGVLRFERARSSVESLSVVVVKRTVLVI